MNISLLFRKRTILSEDGLPWLDAGETYPYPAKRNPTGVARISAILVRAILSILDENVLEARYEGDCVAAYVKSRSTPGSAWCVWREEDFFIPHGSSEKLTYHVGVLGMIQALKNPLQAVDLLNAHLALLEKFQCNGKGESLLPDLVQTADELYYFLRFADAEPVEANDRLAKARVSTLDHRSHLVETWNVLDPTSLNHPGAIGRLLEKGAEFSATEPIFPFPSPDRSEPEPMKGFVGPQAAALIEACQAGENILLGGPTGSGKTFCFQQIAQELSRPVVTIEGKEGLLDLDFLGAILPKPDGSRGWVDGPLARALRLAWEDSVLIFIDEINRIPQKQINLLLTVLNRKSGVFCRLSGIEVDGSRDFYMLEIPMTSEILICPAANLQFVIAGNFGRNYSVYALDPALRRRFETVIEFDYLVAREECALVQKHFPGLSAKVIEALVNVAQETRRMLANGELPGCVDTGSLLHWAAKCERHGAESIAHVMHDARLTWADLVCGRDHIGRVNEGNFQALEDYLKSLGGL
jgi:MoxR-like ATPase